MNSPEIYWKIVSVINFFCIMAGASYCFCCLAKPFMMRKKHVWCIGMTYLACMVLLYYIPLQLQNFTAYGIGTLVAFLVMCVLDFRNIRQKVFLSVTFFLLWWISRGVESTLQSVMLDVVLYIPALMEADLKWQFLVYVGITILHVLVTFLFLWVAVRLILKAYVYKSENMTRKELVLQLFPFLSIAAGRYVFQFFENIYEADTGKYIADIYKSYVWIKCVYQIISFVAILVMILLYQDIKNHQREEKQNELLVGQIEEMKRHVYEVEKLYMDIRSLRHDMGNHIMTLETMCRGRDQQEATEYVEALKEQLCRTDLEIRSGNPVTDVILTEKWKEAEGKKISFTCEFTYPEGEKINAFDVSVILNNALNNAIEAAEKSENPYVHVFSFRKKNVYMIEIRNSFSGVVKTSVDDGILLSDKDEDGHGFGMANIRRAAQKYYGDIHWEQQGDVFMLSVMLMLQ